MGPALVRHGDDALPHEGNHGAGGFNPLWLGAIRCFVPSQIPSSEFRSRAILACRCADSSARSPAPFAGKAGFKRALDELNLVMVEARAMRLFEVCDLDKSGMIGISELEVALMVNDIVPSTPYLTPLDSFYTFDLDGGGDICWVEFKVHGTTRCEDRAEGFPLSTSGVTDPESLLGA